MKKAQVSMEITIMIGIVVIIFISITAFSFFKRAEIRNTEDYLDRKDNCLKISDFISEVYVSGHGTSVVTKNKYNLSVDRWLLIDDNSISCRYNGNVIGNEIVAGDVIIKNVDGNIIIENV